MDAFHKNWSVFVVLSVMLSSLAGHVYAENGWHNGPLFMLIFIIFILLIRTSAGSSAADAIRSFGPIVLGTVIIAVLSAISSTSTIVSAGKSLDFGGVASYAITVLFCGIAMVAVNVYAVSREDQMILGPVITKTAVYFLLFVSGLVSVGYDNSSQMFIVAGYAVFCSAVSSLFLWKATREVYAL